MTTCNTVRRRTFLQGISAGVLAQALARAGNEPNQQPNPYRLVMGWGQLPASMKWGQVNAMDVDRQGNIYILQRNDPAILKFSPEGKLLKSWGEKLFEMAHGITVDRFGFIWTGDAGARDGRGGQVMKFDADGNLLMSLGKKGVTGESPTGETFVAATGIAVASNGDIFVSDGHLVTADRGVGDTRAERGNHRVLKFDKSGKFLKAWGKTGNAPGEFLDPHTIAIDSRNRILVGERGNKRVQVFDPEGRFIVQWPQFGTPEMICIRQNDTMYVSDAQSDARDGSPYKRGVRVGNARDGSVKYFIPEESWDPSQHLGPRLPTEQTTGPIAMTADNDGNVYAADRGAGVGYDKMMKKYVKSK